MPCYSAIVKKLVTVSPDETVEKALKSLKKSKVSAAPVIDEQGKYQGIFSYKGLLDSLIPVSVAVNDGVNIDMKVAAAPGVAKRLWNTKLLPVQDVMERKALTVHPDEPIWEGVAKLTQHGEPLIVIDEHDKLIGMITSASMIEELDNMENSDS